MSKAEHIGLTSRQVQSFINNGFVKVENAFGTDLAMQGRAMGGYRFVARRTRKLEATRNPGGDKVVAPLP